MTRAQLKTFKTWWYLQAKNEFKPHIRLPGDSLLQLTGSKEILDYEEDMAD